jgi:uncharacterized protein
VLGFAFGFRLLVLLVAIAFISGIGITTLGPGGIFVTIALYSLTSVSSGVVAGTAQATFIATGFVGSIAYAYSGELTSDHTRIMALILSVSSLIGAFLGAYLNAFVPRPIFGLLLGAVATLTGATIIYREARELRPLFRLKTTVWQGRVGLGILGFTLGIASGLLGVGGPVLAVPALVLIDVPMLKAVAIAQVQSIFIALFATTGYALQGDVSLPLATLIGIPLLIGTLTGWRVAHLINPAKLKIALGFILAAVGPYLAL